MYFKGEAMIHNYKTTVYKVELFQNIQIIKSCNHLHLCPSGT